MHQWNHTGITLYFLKIATFQTFQLSFLSLWLYVCFLLEWAQSWILSASAKCGKADKAWRSRSAVRTATFRQDSRTWKFWNDSTDSTSEKLRLELKDPNRNVRPKTPHTREDFHRFRVSPSIYHFSPIFISCLIVLVAFVALYHGMPLCLGSVVKRATSRSKSPTPGSLMRRTSISTSCGVKQSQTKGYIINL